jgi:hypothetical protein
MGKPSSFLLAPRSVGPAGKQIAQALPRSQGGRWRLSLVRGRIQPEVVQTLSLSAAVAD